MRVLRQFSYDTMGGQYRKILDTVVQRQIDAAGPDAKLHGRVVLIDLDNTVVDWDKEFVARYGSSGGGVGGGKTTGAALASLVGSRAHYEIERNFPEAEHDAVLATIAEPGFYEGLEVSDDHTSLSHHQQH